MPADLTREEIERLRSTARAFPVAHHTVSLSAEMLLRLLEMAAPTRIEAARLNGNREGIEAAAQWHEARAAILDERTAANANPFKWITGLDRLADFHRSYAEELRTLSPPPAEPSAAQETPDAG